MKTLNLKSNFHLRRVLLPVILALALHENASAQTDWSLEVQSGAAVNVPLPMYIYQSGKPDLSFTARYKTQPFQSPLYYEYRISRWHNEKSWEIEYIHHKIYLTNPISDIDNFSISHGFNMLTLNRGLDISGNIFRAGLGIVIAHPEFTIRGITFDQTRGWFKGGYLPAGIAVNLGYARHINLTNRFFINAEAKTTMAFTRITQKDPAHFQKDLTVDNYNWAFHLILGPGYYFLKQRR